MLAMDAVDRLRHEQSIVLGELNSSTRHDQLVQRLRNIYAEQGIDVTDDLLHEGVQMLEQERYRFQPQGGYLPRLLARIYINRARWLRPALMLALVISLFSYVGNQFSPSLTHSPNPYPHIKLRAAYVEAMGRTEGQGLNNKIDAIYHQGRSALDAGNQQAVTDAIASLNNIMQEVGRGYSLRILSEPGTQSLLLRTDETTGQKTHYLLVEAVDHFDRALALDVRSSEDGKMYNVKRYGVEISPATYNRLVNDIADDGRLSSTTVAVKQPGNANLDYSIPIGPRIITQW